MYENEQAVKNTAAFGWKENPFSLKILSELFVGYPDQTMALQQALANNHKIVLLIGPTGSGKTTLLKWFVQHTSSSDRIVHYVTKPPADPHELVGIFQSVLKPSFFERLMSREKTDIYTLPSYVNKKLRNKFLVFLVDESHEAPIEVLEWLRTLSDQIDNMSVVMAGLPTIDSILGSRLETLANRVIPTSRIELTSLSRAETEELVKKRIEHAGGEGTKPFTREAIDLIFQKSGGFPREILKLADRLVADATRRNMTTIDAALVQEIENKGGERLTLNFMEALPDKQRDVLKMLSANEGATPTEMVKLMGAVDYKTEHHAIRSVNNILRRLMEDGLVVRDRRGKAYVYKLSLKVRTMLITS